MAVEKRTLGKTLAVGLMLGGGYVALRVGYLVANNGNSDDLLGLQEALVGGAVAAGILAVMAVALIVVARRFRLSVRGDLARMLAWVLVTPAILWTLFIPFLAAPEGDTAPSWEDVAPDWAIFAVPLFAVSAVLFLIAIDIQAEGRADPTYAMANAPWPLLRTWNLAVASARTRVRLRSKVPPPNGSRGHGAFAHVDHVEPFHVHEQRG